MRFCHLASSGKAPARVLSANNIANFEEIGELFVAGTVPDIQHRRCGPGAGWIGDAIRAIRRLEELAFDIDEVLCAGITWSLSTGVYFCPSGL